MRLRIVSNGQRMRNMFVPLFLIWPLVLILMLGPLAVLAIFRPGAVWRILKAIGRFAVWASDARGIHIEIRNTRDNILLYLW